MTIKLYDTDPYRTSFSAHVLDVREGKRGLEVRLDRTALYPEGGGQPWDTGTLEGGAAAGEAAPGAVWTVTEVHERDGEIWHSLAPAPQAPVPGMTVTGRIDWARRFDHMQQHSGEHIVSGLICARFGCDNVGFHLGREVVEIDFNAQITPEQLREIQDAANRYIWEDHALEVLHPSAEELARLEYRSKKELTGDVRITRWPGADTCACCGTHVRRSGEIGLVWLLSVMKNKGGVRIEMLAGGRAFAYAQRLKEQNDTVMHRLSAKPLETGAAVERLWAEAEALKAEKIRAQQQRVRELLEACAGGGDVLLLEPELSADSARHLADGLAKTCTGTCAVFFGKTDDPDGEVWRYIIARENGDLRAFGKALNGALDGRGGGRANFLQGSVRADEAAIRAFWEAQA